MDMDMDFKEFLETVNCGSDDGLDNILSTMIKKAEEELDKDRKTMISHLKLDRQIILVHLINYDVQKGIPDDYLLNLETALKISMLINTMLKELEHEG